MFKELKHLARGLTPGGLFLLAMAVPFSLQADNDILAYEYFDYSTDVGVLSSSTAGGSGWSNDPAGWYFRGDLDIMATSTPTSASIQSGSLSPDAYPFDTVGNHIRLPSGNNAFRRLSTPMNFEEAGNEYYFSFIMAADSTTTTSNNYNSFVFGNEESGQGSVSLRYRIVDDVAALRLQAHLSGGSVDLGQDALSFGEEYFIVGRLANEAGSTILQASVFSDESPSLDDFDSWQVEATLAGGIDNVNMLRLRAFDDADVLFDELRIGSSIQAVAIPEPGTYAMLIGFGVMALVVFRRVRR